MSDQAKTKLEKIEALRKSGQTVEAACKEVGVTSTSYYNWRTQSKPKKARKTNKKNKLKVFDMPQVQGGRAFIVFGSPSELAEFARVYQ